MGSLGGGGGGAKVFKRFIYLTPKPNHGCSLLCLQMQEGTAAVSIFSCMVVMYSSDWCLGRGNRICISNYLYPLFMLT